MGDIAAVPRKLGTTSSFPLHASGSSTEHWAGLGSTGAELRERKPSGQPRESGLREGKEKARRSPGGPAATSEELLRVLSSLLPAFLPFLGICLWAGTEARARF